ncbi:hypothetical protein PSAC2689_90225 [Paraburkholderia sacchari]
MPRRNARLRIAKSRGFSEFEGFCTGRFRLGTQSSFKSAMFTNFITPAKRTRFYHWHSNSGSSR